MASDIFSINSFSSTSSDIQSTKSSPVVVDDSDRIAKKPKTTPPIESVVIVEEIEDVDMPLPSNPPVSRPTEIIEPDDDASNDQPAGPSNALFQSSTGASPIKSAFGLKSSAPKEPSKLRFSYKGDASPPLLLQCLFPRHRLLLPQLHPLFPMPNYLVVLPLYRPAWAVQIPRKP